MTQTPDEFLDYLTKATLAAAALDEQPDTAQQNQQTTPAHGIPTGPDVLHIYIVDEPPAPPDAQTPIVESTIAAADPDTGAQETPPPASATPAARRPQSLRMHWILWAGLSITLALVAASMVLVLTLQLFAAPVTVTIMPETQTVEAVISVPLTTTSHAATGTLIGRTLPLLTLTQMKTVPTTGIGHAPATPGHGQVTFYNAAPEGQTVAAGTLLTGKDGTAIVTDQDAVIPAGTLATNGQVSVPAQAVNVGPAGNIAAGDLYGACCRENVFVQNTAAFSGGHDAYSYPMVTTQDIMQAKTALRASLLHSVQAAFMAELASTEAVIMPIPCQETSFGTADVGQEATHISIGVSETCSDVAYDTHALAALVTGQVQKQAARHLGTRYALSGTVTTAITKTTAKGTSLLLTVKAAGTWAYQFSLNDLQHLAQMIAGKSSTAATRLLAEQPGVSQVEMSTSGTLPRDANRIHVLVVEGM